MTRPHIFHRELAGEVISLIDPEYPKIAELITEAQRIIAEMNTGFRDAGEVRALFERLTGTAVDESLLLLPPFYTDFGKSIRVGRNVFINHACEFMDRGGITIEDDVLVGPKVNLILHSTEDLFDATYCANGIHTPTLIIQPGTRPSHGRRPAGRGTSVFRRRGR